MTPDVTSRHTPEYYKKWAPDLYKDRVYRWIDSYQLVFPILLFAALYAFGGMSWLIWGGFVRTIFVLHTTWLVNSATHVWGYRTHETRDSSTNLWWVALWPMAKAGTTTITPSRPPPATVCGGGKWI